MALSLIVVLLAGLRALLRFFTGLYVCLNRGDVNSNAQKVREVFVLAVSVLGL